MGPIWGGDLKIQRHSITHPAPQFQYSSACDAIMKMIIAIITRHYNCKADTKHD